MITSIGGFGAGDSLAYPAKDVGEGFASAPSEAKSIFGDDHRVRREIHR